MRTSVAVASLAIVALAILVPSISGVVVKSAVGVPVESATFSNKQAKSDSDAKTAEANKEDEVYTDGNVKFARGSANTATTQDKDSAQSAVNEVNIKGIDGSSYRSKVASLKTATLDAATKTSNSYVSYGRA